MTFERHRSECVTEQHMGFLNFFFFLLERVLFLTSIFLSCLAILDALSNFTQILHFSKFIHNLDPRRNESGRARAHATH